MLFNDAAENLDARMQRAPYYFMWQDAQPIVVQSKEARV